MHTFDIYFSGQLLAGTSPVEARMAIGRMFRLEGDALERLFSGAPVRVKSGVDVEKAGRFREAFRQAGALIDIVPQGAPPPQTAETGEAPASSPGSADEMQLLPPHTGSLEDCAPRVEARPLPDISWMELDDPGVLLDDTPPAAPADIGTPEFTTSGAGQFSLEDCERVTEARPIPDISHLALVGNDDNKSSD